MIAINSILTISIFDLLFNFKVKFQITLYLNQSVFDKSLRERDATNDVT